MAFKLKFELVDATKGVGDFIYQTEEARKMVETNQDFSHFHESINKKKFSFSFSFEGKC